MKKGEKTCLTVLTALLGLALSPMVFFLTAVAGGDFMPWLWPDKITLLPTMLIILGPVVIGIAWSRFAVVEWKNGDVGIRIGLTAIVWALVAGAEAAFYLKGIFGA